MCHRIDPQRFRHRFPTFGLFCGWSQGAAEVAAIDCAKGHRMHTSLRWVFAWLALAGIALIASSTGAQEGQFPNRAVRIIVPLTAGSAADVLARQVASQMSASWGQPVIVENRTGAGGTIGVAAVAKARPDGYTILLHSAAFATSAAVYAKLPYDPAKDLIPVSQLAIAPLVLVVAPELGPKSVKELIALAKARPGKMTFASSGIGTSTHFGAEQFKLAAGIDVLHVPYKGPSEGLVDTVARRTDYFLAPVIAASPFLKDGRLLPLAVTTRQRVPALPNVPSVAEAGLQDFEYRDWWGLFVPAGTPQSIIDKSARETTRILGLPDIQKQLAVQGAQASPLGPAEFGTFVRSSIEKARMIVASTGIKSE
jgi:tripartite-type tricarboxylate transporter receptor subunit TctC